MIKSVIIEDEIRSRKILENSLKNYCENVEVSGFAETVASGIETIRNIKPDLVFLDIDLPDGSGFEILDQLEKPWPDIIFVTAYNEFAVNAFRISAIDYLLKPVDPEQLQAAVEKASNNSDSEDQQFKKIETFKENNVSGRLNKMVLPTFNGLQFVRTDQIVRLKADGNYTTFYLVDGNKFLVSKPIREYEALLENLGFYRVHQSSIVNLNLIEKYIRGEGGIIVMEDGSEVEVARRRKEGFLLRLSGG